MASESLPRLNNLFTHLLDAVGVGVEKQTVPPVHGRASTLKRARPGLIVAVLVWSLILVLSVGTNGALAAALAQHMSFPPGLVDAFSSLTGERGPEPARDLTDLVVPSPGPETDHFQDSGLPALAGNRSAFASSIVAPVAKTIPGHGSLLGLDFMHALANDYSPYVDISTHPAAWTHGGVARLIAITGPVHTGRIVRARPGGAVSDERSDDAQAPAPEIPAPPVVVAPYANEPAVDSMPWANPNTGPASTQPVDEVVVLDDKLPTRAQPPVTEDDVPPIDFVPEPLLAVDVAQPVAALAATQVPGPGTMGLLAGAFVAWPIATRLRIGAARRTRSRGSRSAA